MCTRDGSMSVAAPASVMTERYRRRRGPAAGSRTRGERIPALEDEGVARELVLVPHRRRHRVVQLSSGHPRVAEHPRERRDGRCGIGKGLPAIIRRRGPLREHLSGRCRGGEPAQLVGRRRAHVEARGQAGRGSTAGRTGEVTRLGGRIRRARRQSQNRRRGRRGTCAAKPTVSDGHNAILTGTYHSATRAQGQQPRPRPKSCTQ